MTSLADFTKEEADLIVSLPYKAGMWVSHSEDQDGESDDTHENKALTTCLRHFAKMGDGKPLFAQIIKEALRSEDKWADWADQSFTLIEDIQKAVPILRGKASVDEIKLIKRSLMEIGTAVAQSSDEYGDDSASEGIFGKILSKFSNLADHDAGHPMNVSASEDSALEKLRAALKGKA
jgi:hypothetical protein